MRNPVRLISPLKQGILPLLLCLELAHENSWHQLLCVDLPIFRKRFH